MSILICFAFNSWSFGFYSTLSSSQPPSTLPVVRPPPLFGPLNTSHDAIGASHRAHALPSNQELRLWHMHPDRRQWEPISFQDRRSVMWKLMWCRKGQSSAFTHNWLETLFCLMCVKGRKSKKHFEQRIFWDFPAF